MIAFRNELTVSQRPLRIYLFKFVNRMHDGSNEYIKDECRR